MSGRITTTIRHSASQFVASPVKLAKTLSSFPLRCAANRAKHNKKSQVQRGQGAQTDDRINNLLHKFPFSLPYGGYVDRTTGGWNDRSTSGAFWSEGANSGSGARDLYFSGVNVWPGNNYYKTAGFPVRCVAKSPKQANKTKGNLKIVFYRKTNLIYSTLSPLPSHPHIAGADRALSETLSSFSYLPPPLPSPCQHSV